jgi:transglutaminase-like putative cysteine protease
MRNLLLLLAVICACKGSDESKGSSAAKVNAAAADDPWAKKQVNAADVKDKDLARLIELAQNGPGKLQFPQADAVVALERDDITLAPDGTVTTKHHSIVKLLDPQRGKDKYADLHIPFDSKRETLTIEVARTVNDDGKPHEVSKDEIADIVPPRIADATIYADVRERVVTFPAVDTGSVLELKFTRTTKPTPDAPLGGEELLAQWNPVTERTVTITTPSGQPPKFSVEGQKLEPTVTSVGANKTYTFKVENLPDRHPESGSLQESAVLPRLVYGFQPSWNKVLESVATRFLDKAVPASMPAAITAEADRIVTGATTDAEKATKLFAFVSHDIRSIDLPLGWAGYEPHAPDVVLQNRYGDDRDKVGLLLALASTQGIKGRPVLVRTGKVPVISSVPTVAQFDRMIAKLDIGNQDVWIDPSDEYGQYGVAFAGQDNLVLPLDKNGKELGSRPALDSSTSVSTTKATYTMTANGDLTAKYTYDLTGWYADRASGQLRALKGELLDRHFQQGAAGVAASALDKGHTVSDTLSVTGPVSVTHDVSVPGYSQAQANFRVFELPPVSLSVANDEPEANLSTRKTDLWVGTPRTERGELSVQIPSGWKVSYVPPKLEGSAEGVTFSSSCEANGQLVTCRGEIKLDRLVVPAAKYGAFREALTKLQAYERRIVLLTRA